ncbi:hypothetical protein M0R72_10475 [Candidatus Pacearchaeota archaeon]|jgi:cell shape-determining protein MreC|nr:hypothetical protein [Candidatus Pacearchaeota archaeon]
MDWLDICVIVIMAIGVWAFVVCTLNNPGRALSLACKKLTELQEENRLLVEDNKKLQYLNGGLTDMNKRLKEDLQWKDMHHQSLVDGLLNQIHDYQEAQEQKSVGQQPDDHA